MKPYITVMLFLLQAMYAAAQQTTIKSISGWSMVAENNIVTMKAPSLLSGNNRFYYQIQPLQNYTNTTWFEKQIQLELTKKKWVAEKTNVVDKNGMLAYITQVKDSANQTWYISFLGYATQDKHTRLSILYGHNEAYFYNNSKPPMQHFIALAKNEHIVTNTSTPNNNIGSQNHTNTNTSITNYPVPNNSAGTLQPKDIETVIIHLEYEYGVGGAAYPVYNPYILLKDGSIVKNVSQSPRDIDVAQAKATMPKNWGTWKRNGADYSIYWPAAAPKNQHSQWKASSCFSVNGGSNSTLNGLFISLSGGGNTAFGGSVITFNSKKITFTSNGNFTLAKTTGGISDQAWGSHYKNLKESGTYIINNYSIEFTFTDGKKVRNFFYFYPDKKTTFGIGTSTYTPSSK